MHLEWERGHYSSQVILKYFKTWFLLHLRVGGKTNTSLLMCPLRHSFRTCPSLWMYLLFSSIQFSPKLWQMQFKVWPDQQFHVSFLYHVPVHLMVELLCTVITTSHPFDHLLTFMSSGLSHRFASHCTVISGTEGNCKSSIDGYIDAHSSIKCMAESFPVVLSNWLLSQNTNICQWNFYWESGSIIIVKLNKSDGQICLF